MMRQTAQDYQTHLVSRAIGRNGLTARSSLVALLALSVTWGFDASAGESNPLTPSRHMPRGPDAGATDCSITDAASTILTCQNDMRLSEQQIEQWSAHHLSNEAKGIVDDFLKMRMGLSKQIQNDRSVIRMLQARPTGLHVSPTAVSPQAAEPHSQNQVWSGVELSTKPYTAPSDYIAIYKFTGSFKVPAIYVPDTASKSCDGKNNKSYAGSWWIGIGGDPNGSIYQAGVKGVIICTAGSTVPAVTYLGWEEDYPFQPTEVYLPAFNNKIKAGDTITVTVSSNFNTAPTAGGVMTYQITDGTVSSGLKQIKDGGYAPYTSAEAVVEREVEADAGPPYYHSMAGTSSGSTSAMFNALTYDLVYQTNAGTGNPIKFATVNNLDLNQSVGSGSRCSTIDTWCVKAFLNDHTKTECDVSKGSGPSTTTSGYIYTFVGEPEASGCYTPPPP